jgi:protein TonB
MQLSIERPQPRHASQFLRVFGMVLAVHMGLGWLLLVSPNLQLPRKLAPITVEIGAADPAVQRGLEQAVAAQDGQGGAANRTPAQKTQTKTQPLAKPLAPAPSSASPDAPLVAKPVEQFTPPAESVAAALPGSATLAAPKGQAQVTQETVKITEPDLQAAYKENPKPPYPKAAFRVGAEGTVEIAVEINPDGTVAAVKLAQSSGNEWLDQSALDTVKGWRFRSARKDGVLSNSVVRVPITYRLRAAR